MVVGGSSNGSSDVKSQWTFEEVSSLDIDLNGPIDGSYYATLCVPFDVTAIEGATAYTLAKADATTLNMTETTTIAAGTPVLLIGSAATATATISTATSSTISTETALTGQYFANTSFDGTTNYVLGTDGSKVGFFHWTGSTLKANRAYIAGGEGSAKGYYLNSETDGIADAVVANGMLNGDVYNLQGQKVNNARKGVFIVGGKKIVR